MNRKISFKDLDGWLKTVVVFNWIQIGAIALMLLIMIIGVIFALAV